MSARIVPPPGARKPSARAAPSCATVAEAAAVAAVTNSISLRIVVPVCGRRPSFRRAHANPFHPAVERPSFVLTHWPPEQRDVEGIVRSLAVHEDRGLYAVGKQIVARRGRAPLR